MARKLLGWFRWQTNYPTFKSQGKIPVWLGVYDAGDSYVVEAFFTDANSPLEPIGAIISNLYTLQIIKSFKSSSYSWTEYTKFRLFIFHSRTLVKDRLEKKLSGLYGFKAKTKFVYVKFEPRLKLEDVVLSLAMNSL